MMALGRRSFLVGAAALAAGTAGRAAAMEDEEMFGLIGKMRAASGQRDRLIAILLEATGEMPGCLSYVVARDPADADAIWITEVWDSEASHKASLSLPRVRAAINQAMPMIAGFESSIPTEPVGGVGLPRRTGP